MNTITEIDVQETFGTIDVGGQTLYYKEVGTGDKLILAFHGYGNDSSLFRFLKHQDFTVISFDLPFQGKSVGTKDTPLTKENLYKLVRHFLKEKGVRKVSLVGFSLGARICLCIAENMPEHISNMILIAPDGIVHNRFYHFVTKTGFGNSLFRNFVKKGRGYLRFFSFMNKVKLLSNSKFKFASQYIETEKLRTLLYDIWMTTSPLVPDLKKVDQNIKKRKMPVHLYVGKKDKIIPYKNALKFKGKSEQIKLHLFERGHNLLFFEEVRGIVKAWLFRTYSSSKEK